MTLHEAIEKLLIQTGQPMITTEIAVELNKNKWYEKKDGSSISPFQIHGRTKNYSDLFIRNGSTVSLNRQSNANFTVKRAIEKPKPKLIDTSENINLIENVLINESNFKNANLIDNLVPDKPGLYCIRIINSNRSEE